MFLPASCIWFALAAAICSTIFCNRSKWKQPSKLYFPSPPSELFLGHLRTLTQSTAWLALTDWGKHYGDILQLSVAKKSIIVIRKADDAHVLLDNRGAIYSDRPHSIIQGEIGGKEHFTANARYGDDFRMLRRFTIQYFNSRQHVKMYPLLQAQVKILLKNIFESPQKFDTHLDRFAAGAIVRSTYGYKIQSNEDAYNKLAVEAFSALLPLGINGLTVIDLIPFLRYLPSWLPGMSLLKRAKKARILIDKMVEEPYQQVKDRRRSGSEEVSMVDALLEDYERSGVVDEKREFLIKYAASQIYGAGVETTVTLLYTFIFEMVHHPEIARKAQAEIENVLGKNQLPTFNDRPDLPYIDCILKEVMRINPGVPLGVPHASTVEDIYKDRTIPAESIIIPNIWAMTHDEQYFPDPNTFNPDRFVHMVGKEDGIVHHLNTYRPDDPAALIFGFGRRICPGRFAADAGAWLVMANILAVFDIMPAVDSVTGKEILPEFAWENRGMVAKLKTFEAKIIPRSKDHTLLISQE